MPTIFKIFIGIALLGWSVLLWLTLAHAVPSNASVAFSMNQFRNTQKEKQLKKTVIAVVLDESGSMDSVKEKTISGFNEYIQNMKNRGMDATVVFTRFNGRGIASTTADIRELPTLNATTYRPEDNTPLYDAIMQTISEVGKSDPSGNVLFVILTDGLENASTQNTRDSVKASIRALQHAGWAFVYLGANQDAILAAADVGIHIGNAMSYQAGDIKSVFRGMSNATVEAVNTGTVTGARTFMATQGVQMKIDKEISEEKNELAR